MGNTFGGCMRPVSCAKGIIDKNITKRRKLAGKLSIVFFFLLVKT